MDDTQQTVADDRPPGGEVVFTADKVAEIKAEARDLGAPTPATQIRRPDGRPGYTEMIAGATLVDQDPLPGGPAVAAARHRLDKARANGAHQDEVDRLQRELADVAGYRLREHDQPLPTAGERPVIHELVITDIANRLELGKKRYGQPLRAFNGRDQLEDAYDEVLDLAVYLRAKIEEDRKHRAEAAAAGEEDIPAPPRTGRSRVAVVDGVMWHWHDREWHPIPTPDGLDEDTRAAIAAHVDPAVLTGRTEQ